MNALLSLTPPLDTTAVTQLRDANRRVNLSESVRRSARILLALHERGAASKVAKELFVSRSTIAATIRRYRTGGVAAVLAHVAQTGRPPFDQAIRTRVLEIAQGTPELTISQIAEKAGVSVGFASGLVKRRRKRGTRTALLSAASKPALEPPLDGGGIQRLLDVKRRMNLPEGTRRSARILIKLHEEKSGKAAAEELDVSRRTVQKTVRRYRTGGLAAVLAHDFRPGRPPLPAETRALVLRLRQVQPNESLRSIAAKAGVSVGYAHYVTKAGV